MSQYAGAAEASTAFGTIILLIGAAVWMSQFVFDVFTSWGWAMFIGGTWVVLGVLLLFPDIRLYTGAATAAEKYHQPSK